MHAERFLFMVQNFEYQIYNRTIWSAKTFTNILAIRLNFFQYGMNKFQYYQGWLGLSRKIKTKIKVANALENI